MGRRLNKLMVLGKEAVNPALNLLESVFGQIRGDTKHVDPSVNRRRCIRCKVRYDKRKIKGEAVVLDGKETGEFEAPAFNTDLFHSALCADQSPAAPFKLSRQAHRAMLRRKAAEEVAQEMGRGPKAAEPRRARRRVILKRAAKMYRDQKAGE